MHPIILPIAELKPALSGLSKVIHSKTTLPILRCVKIERTSEGWIALTGTDLERFITVRLEQPAEGTPLTLLVPYDQLSDLIKNAPKGESIHLEPGATETMVKIRFALAGQLGESIFKTPKPDEFPATPKLKADPIPLPAGFRQTIHEAMECASSDETRLVLNGAFIDTANAKGTYVVATDGRHLYSANSFTLPLKHSVIVPHHKFLGWKEFNGDGEWQMKATDEHVQISSRRWRFISRQIQGKYPDWRVVMPNPTEAKTNIEIDPNSLESLLQLLQRLPSHEEQYRSVGISWTKDKRLELMVKKEPSDPWQRVPVPQVKGTGPETTIFIDRRYLFKALRYGLNHLHLIDEISPLRLSSGGKQMVVMPVRLNGNPPLLRPAPQPQDRPNHKPASPPTTNPHPPMTQAPVIEPPSTKPPTLEEVMEQTNQLREILQSGLNQAKELTGKLRFIQREQKSSSKEFESVRSRLRSLQGLKF